MTKTSPGLDVGRMAMQGFGQVMDSMEFVKRAWSNFQMATPFTPTLDVEELEKRIADLRAVEQWLSLNQHMLRSTIQGLEIQYGTLSAINSVSHAFGKAVKTTDDSTAQTLARFAAAAAQKAVAAPVIPVVPPVPVAPTVPAGSGSAGPGSVSAMPFSMFDWSPFAMPSSAFTTPRRAAPSGPEAEPDTDAGPDPDLGAKRKAAAAPDPSPARGSFDWQGSGSDSLRGSRPGSWPAGKAGAAQFDASEAEPSAAPEASPTAPTGAPESRAPGSAPPGASGPAQAAGPGSPSGGSAASSPGKRDASAPAGSDAAQAAALNPLAWWEMLQENFRQIAQAATGQAGPAVAAAPTAGRSRADSATVRSAGKSGPAQSGAGSKAGKARRASKAGKGSKAGNAAARKPAAKSSQAGAKARARKPGEQG